MVEDKKISTAFKEIEAGLREGQGVDSLTSAWRRGDDYTVTVPQKSRRGKFGVNSSGKAGGAVK